jgi:hypothetical protein
MWKLLFVDNYDDQTGDRHTSATAVATFFMLLLLSPFKVGASAPVSGIKLLPSTSQV